MYEVILRGNRFCDRISWIWINLQNGKIQDAMNRVSTRGDRKNDACDGLRLRIPILFTIPVLLGAIAFPGLRKDQRR
ncbi:MAG TPA: hypothetical protein VE944_26050 [Nostoc sp.]|uniref:hypothetical protein n=1 Tax=Nostoc sp. TaxID=1180 RepID=UPI002D27BB3C|nr:hypothetical protein [Nostoc sp.]HYX17757.1 hypothetical protein [Nostoc sp.]